MNNITSYIIVGNKKYHYTLKKERDGIVFIECKDAKIAQDFLAEDIPDLIIDLPNLIIAEKEYQDTQSSVLRFRISPTDKARIEKKAVESGYKSVSDYLRSLALGV